MGGSRKKLIFFVDFFRVCAILFSVMRDDISCEEAFEVKAEMAPEPVLADGVDLGRLFDRVRAPRDWAGSEFADAVYGPKKP